MSTQLFWQTLQEGSDPLGKSVTPRPVTDGEDVGSRILRVLDDAGGSATLFEVDVRVGVPRKRSHLAVNRLSRQGLVIQEKGAGGEVVLRLDPHRFPPRSRAHKYARRQQQP